MKLWNEFLAWRETEVQDAAYVDPARYPDMHAVVKSSGITGYHEICDLIEDFAATTPKSILLLPFTHCHRIVMSHALPRTSKLIQVAFDPDIGLLSSAADGFSELSSLWFRGWRVRGRVKVGGDHHVVMTGQDLSFVRAGVLSGNRLALEGTGAAQQHYTTGCSRVESAIVSACCTGSQDDMYFINLTYGGKL